jgi:AAA15 family ATPase/GTPase
MFIEFKVGNFRSFRDEQKFTMQAAPLRANDNGLEEDNVFDFEGYRLLKSKAIFGGNASGKSNLVKAFSAFALMVSKSVSKEGLAQQIWEDRFLLLTDWDSQPIFFQYIFTMKELTYRYGFQILNGKITYEWLFGKDGDNEERYFIRDPEGLKIEEKYFTGSGVYMDQALSGNNELFRPDSLFLTGAALNGNKLAGSLRDIIVSVICVDSLIDGKAKDAAMYDLEHGTDIEKAELINLIRAGDTNVEDLKLLKLPDHINKQFSRSISGASNDDEYQMLFSIHSRYDEKGQFVSKIQVPFGKWESEGTGKLLAIGALVLKSLRNGRTLIIDEFDARFHPNLTLKIVQLFHSERTNPLHAQIIFVTHDSGLLRRADLRRDQICFINKDKYGISSLRTLIEFKGVRKDASYEKEYLNGNYEAIPYLDEMDWVLTQNSEKNEL